MHNMHLYKDGQIQNPETLWEKCSITSFSGSFRNYILNSYCSKTHPGHILESLGSTSYWPERALLYEKRHFFEKRPLKISPSPYSIPFLSVLHQNKALYNFHKRGQHSLNSKTQYRSRIYHVISKTTLSIGGQSNHNCCMFQLPQTSPKSLKTRISNLDAIRFYQSTRRSIGLQATNSKNIWHCRFRKKGTTFHWQVLFPTIPWFESLTW